MTDCDVLVLGAGIAGLTAARTAQRAGAAVLVLDAHKPGGRARTTTFDGFTFNHGGHALYTGGPGAAVCKALDVRPPGVRAPLRRYRLLRDGELHRLPAGPQTLARTTALSARGKAAFAKLFVRLALLRFDDLADVSAADWIDSCELPEDASALVRTLLRTSTFTDRFEVLSADAAVAQLKAVSMGVRYLHGGWGPLVGLLGAGLPIVTGARAATVDETAGGVAAETVDGRRLTARAAIVALGTPAACAAVLPGGQAWPEVGRPLEVAGLDVAATGSPSPGWVMSVDEPLFVAQQSPPARQSPPGTSVLAVTRYGVRSAEQDRADLIRYRRLAGVEDDAVVRERFLARMTVTAAMPEVDRGGLPGRPRTTDTGSDRILLAGDWVGDRGLLADASFCSGHDAALAAVRIATRSATMAA